MATLESNLQNCKKCGGTHIAVSELFIPVNDQIQAHETVGFYVLCLVCKQEGPLTPYKQVSIREWNKIQLDAA